jgi:hypothetical protein
MYSAVFCAAEAWHMEHWNLHDLMKTATEADSGIIFANLGEVEDQG